MWQWFVEGLFNFLRSEQFFHLNIHAFCEYIWTNVWTTLRVCLSARVKFSGLQRVWVLCCVRTWGCIRRRQTREGRVLAAPHNEHDTLRDALNVNTHNAQSESGPMNCSTAKRSFSEKESSARLLLYEYVWLQYSTVMYSWTIHNEYTVQHSTEIESGRQWHLLSGFGAVLHLLQQFGRVVWQQLRVAARLEVRPDCASVHNTICCTVRVYTAYGPHVITFWDQKYDVILIGHFHNFYVRRIQKTSRLEKQ